MADAGIKKVPRFFFAVLGAVFFLLFSCVSETVYEGYIPDFDEATLARLESLLDKNDPLQVLQDTDTLKRKRDTTEQYAQALLELEIRATDNMASQFDDALEQKRYREALSLYRSLVAVKGIEHAPKNVSEKDLILSIARTALEQGQDAAGLMLFLKAVSEGQMTLEDILFFGDVAAAQENVNALRRISALLESQGGVVPDRYRRVLDREITAAGMIEGTVTVWVNRGIQLVSGVGYPERVVGSGFFIDRNGYIITNYHVISSEVDPEYEGYSRLFVRPPGEPSTRIPARVVGWNREFDIALLKTGLESDFSFLFEEGIVSAPGDTIYAIGSPAGLESTITSGIVSAKDRELLQMGDAVQVDVPINAGNSGGPLVDESGKLAGVVFAGIEQFEGVNFAIPSEWLVHLIPGLHEEGELALPWIGAMVVKAQEGLEVMYVVPGSPAHRAGLSPGDILFRLSGQDVSLVRDVHHVLLDLSPDTLIEIEWRRGEENLRGYIKLAMRPFKPLETALDRDARENLLVPLFGMQVEKSGTSGLEQMYIVKKVYPGFTADETGLSPNDPFSIRNWVVEKEQGFAAVQIRVKKRKAGFIESVIQIATYLETAHFI